MADGRDFDVVIVGAGAAGITACRHLAAAKLRVLAQPVADRLFFAGEACSRNHFGTAHAAFTSAVSAAERIVAILVPAS